MTTPAPAPAPGPAPVSDGKTLGIVGLVLAFVFSLAGLIVSIIASNQSKAAGVPNTPAKVGIILSIIFLVLTVIGVIANIALLGAATTYSTY
jgi:preprotein translocase subunit SecG